jgi:lipopolysaccharide transport system ATP-binding protein
LEVGTGFHPELSGRENVFLNGSILGMTRREIRSQFDQIVEFAEISKFIDTPVKRYSSGMYVRLAFAIAAHLQPEVLIVDEVLAVGDASFQKKCLDKMHGVARSGRTVLFVSHNMGAVRSLCDRGIVLKNGEMAFDGACDDAIAMYLGGLAQGSEDAFSIDNPDRSGDGRIRLTAGRVSQGSNSGGHVIAGKDVELEFDYANSGNVQRADIGLTIYNQYGIAVCNISTELANYDLGLASEGTIGCRLPNLPLMPGEYRIAVVIRVDGAACDHIPNALVFTVDSSVFYPTGRVPPGQYSIFMLDHEWCHE